MTFYFDYSKVWLMQSVGVFVVKTNNINRLHTRISMTQILVNAGERMEGAKIISAVTKQCMVSDYVFP